MKLRIHSGFASVAGLWLAMATPVQLSGQGAGATGFEVMQMPAGARAAALAGAYAASAEDADVIFFNPAGLASLGSAASLSYQRHVMEISLGSLAGSLSVGRVSVGAGIAFLDGGEVPEIVPDERFGGQRGRATGATVSARESALRIVVAAPILDGRLEVGGGAGLAMSELAGISRNAPLVDLGARTALGNGVHLGFALRNLGGSAGGGGGSDPIGLPSEARLGGSYAWRDDNQMGVNLSSDAAYRIREHALALHAGVEAGLLPADIEQVAAVFRFGFVADRYLPAANSFQVGAGVSLSGISVDYAYQDLEFFGAAHRFGLRWSGRAVR